jgi:hypothetical protein
MGVPATVGQLKSNIADMQIGDYIVCNYTASSGAVGTFSNFGGTAGTEIPVSSSATPNGTFYFVKVAKGLLVADRVVQHTISWDTLNAGKFIEGKTMTLGTTSGILRSLTGGVAYADANGNKSTTDLGYGAFPVNNEWDKYIVNFPQELIQSGKTLDDVFHFTNARTWVQDTWYNLNTNRVQRGYTLANNGAKYISYFTSSSSSNTHGFRPVFEYIES